MGKQWENNRTTNQLYLYLFQSTFKVIFRFFIGIFLSRKSLKIKRNALFKGIPRHCDFGGIQTHDLQNRNLMSYIYNYLIFSIL